MHCAVLHIGFADGSWTLDLVKKKKGSRGYGSVSGISRWCAAAVAAVWVRREGD